MLFYIVVFKLALFAIGVVAAPAAIACNKDNCLRAISASVFPTRLGTADCSSYFMVTVTPATTTITVTATTSPTSILAAAITNTDTLTIVTTITNTATGISDQTNTITATEVDTLTATSIIPITETDIIGSPGKKIKRVVNEDRSTPSITLAPRQLAVSPSATPSYASACSGSVRYSSACSCLGVTHSTITASAPNTTITVTATNVQSLALTQTSSVIATYLTTEIDSATIASSITETSVITTTLDIPTTIYQTATVATVSSCAATPTVLLVASGGPFNGQYAKLIDTTGISGAKVINFTTNAGAASGFVIDSNGHLSSGGYYATVIGGFSHALLQFLTPANINIEYEEATCNITPTGLATGVLSCHVDASNLFEVSLLPSIDGAGVEITQVRGVESTLFTFDTICVS